jgi:signal peptidase I
MARRSYVHDYFQAGVIAIIIALFVRTYLVQAFQIPSASMENSILVGDHVLVNKFIFGHLASNVGGEVLPVGQVKRRDVIVFKFPDAPEKDYVKRVIGEPGDWVRIDNGVVSIRQAGQTTFSSLPEQYVQHIDPVGAPDPDRLNNREPVEVPPDSYYVLGDNRDDSRDSRDWGFVHRSMIRGKVLLVYWSVEIPPPPLEGTAQRGGLAAMWDSLSASYGRTRWGRTFHVVR